MLDFKLISMFNFVYKREYDDICDKLFIGMNRILGYLM